MLKIYRNVHSHVKKCTEISMTRIEKCTIPEKLLNLIGQPDILTIFLKIKRYNFYVVVIDDISKKHFLSEQTQFIHVH